jgi:hypothetical protein
MNEYTLLNQNIFSYTMRLILRWFLLILNTEVVPAYTYVLPIRVSLIIQRLYAYQ